MTRRRLLAAAATLPVLLVARHGVELAGDVIRAAVQSVRPVATGISATRCAQCGSAGHTMLDRPVRLAPQGPRISGIDRRTVLKGAVGATAAPPRDRSCPSWIRRPSALAATTTSLPACR